MSRGLSCVHIRSVLTLSSSLQEIVWQQMPQPPKLAAAVPNMVVVCCARAVGCQSLAAAALPMLRLQLQQAGFSSLQAGMLMQGAVLCTGCLGRVLLLQPP